MNPRTLDYTYYDHRWSNNHNGGIVHSWYLADEGTLVFDGTNSKGDPVKVIRQKLLGVVYFVDAITSPDIIKAQFGSSFHERVPSLRDVEDVANIGTILYPEGLLYPENLNWWEYLLFGAIHYAKETILVSLP